MPSVRLPVESLKAVEARTGTAHCVLLLPGTAAAVPRAAEASAGAELLLAPLPPVLSRCRVNGREPRVTGSLKVTIRLRTCERCDWPNATAGESLTATGPETVGPGVMLPVRVSV